MHSLVVFVFLTVLTIGCAQPVGLGSTIDFRGDWDSNPQLFFGRNNWASGDSVRPNISIRFENKIVRQGNFSARFEVSPLDLIHGGERSEVVNIRLANASIDISENFPGTVYFYAFSVYFPAPFVAPKGSDPWQILLQLHGPNSGIYNGASPAFGFHALNRYYITVNGGNMVQTKYRNQIYEFEDGGDILTDSWEDFVLEIKWDIQQRGHVNVWRRKWGQGEKTFTLVVSAKNESTLMYDSYSIVNGNDTNGGVVPDYHYWKHGVYRGHIGGTNLTTVAYLDGFTRAKNFDDAAWNAFGDIPGAPINSQSPTVDSSPQSDNSPTSSGSPNARSPYSQGPSTSTSTASLSLYSVIIFALNFGAMLFL